MRTLARTALGCAVAAVALIGMTMPASASRPIDDRHAGAGTTASERRPDNRPGPLTARQEARRKAALEMVRSGEAAPDEDGVVALAEDKFVQTAVTGTDQLFTILAEFGDAGSGRLGTDPGPLHNEIEAPDRSVDNTTIWEPDFDRAYYLDVFFGEDESMNDYYEAQSAGMYHLAGDVSEWVQVPGNASTYGDNVVEDFGGAWRFVEDSLQAWYDAQVAAGASLSDIQAYLAIFDEWDRYDHDADGEFDEPDGYIDHFQAVHAGEGEEAGGGAQGEDAIWSHRWYVNQTDFGVTGPEGNLLGGAPIGDTGFWVGDYTTEPENGGLGVFAHEYGHDLMLPDLYDTSGGDNGTGFWTIMSAGSWLNHGGDTIGDVPDGFGPWEKLQLGWLDFEVVDQGAVASPRTLGSASSHHADAAQAVIVDVPDEPVETTYNAPYSGEHEWWSGSGDDLNVSLSNSVDLTGINRATLTAKAWYDIEAGYDYLHFEVSVAGGPWTEVGTPLSSSSNGRWTTLRYALPGGAPVEYRFRYQTDGGVAPPGVFLDDITVRTGGTTLFSDDVESGEDGWSTDGWTIMGGVGVSEGDRYYLLEYRTYTGYDATLAEGPYNFSNLITRPDWVERFAYQDGLLVWMVDEAYANNNTLEHPGHGLVLPVDARPAPILFEDGVRIGNRRQPFDATFGLEATDATTFHREVAKGNKVTLVEAAVPSSAGIATFDDTDPTAYYSAANPLGSTLVAGHGVVVLVTSQGATMGITVTNPA